MLRYADVLFKVVGAKMAEKVLIYFMDGPLALFPMGVGHECFFEEQSIIMSLQTYICSCKLNDNSLSSIFKARIALVLHFVIEN